MLEKLKNQLAGQYPMGCAQELEDTEAELEFDIFGSEIALELGSMIVNMAQKYGEDVVVQITREKDQIVIFQYLGDSRSQRNIDFAQGKRNTVLKTGHCSLWALAQELSIGGLDEVFNENSQCIPVGGAFPIYVNSELVATICVSGLREGMDHQVIIDALGNYLNKEVPEFRGKLI
ncbi:heme-binding protein [Paenibacillus sp. DMB5]|uniref:heme-binding protein n=1 Tax=Paenibacillus sp. DMB5 TaxID=1780103 RepID=UPI00076BF22D|nr:heme-binding protein [Paenibacillus sp. DMB5]KUP25916.1 hypothetical protein AWJ19_33405 [Paenibacillus sp. DMB5]